MHQRVSRFLLIINIISLRYRHAHTHTHTTQAVDRHKYIHTYNTHISDILDGKTENFHYYSLLPSLLNANKIIQKISKTIKIRKNNKKRKNIEKEKKPS